MEELEKNETSAHAEENTVSLASAQALADALAKIEVYTPTTWVDNSSPDIDAEHLNKPEQAIKRVTDALNSAVDVIKDLQSQVTKNAGDISTVNNNLGKYNFNLGNTTANNHKNIDRIATFSGGTWINKDYNADFGGQWCFVDSFLIDGNGAAMQRIMSAQTNTVLATRYCEKNVWGDWNISVTKSDLDLKLNNTSIFVGNGKDFGQAIKEAGIVKLNRVGFFICNNPSNSPLENGLIILAHNVGYWNNHPMYIQINGSSISCGTLNCSDYTHITKD
nr:MAG TPA: hypothetical protein [Caudoviricetes sp.]